VEYLIVANNKQELNVHNNGRENIKAKVRTFYHHFGVQEIQAWHQKS